MKVFLQKDIEKVGLAGEIIKVPDGFARNFLLPRKLAVEVTPKNEAFFAKKVHAVENRKTVIESKTSMLAEKIKSLRLTIKRKIHDDGKLFGAINPSEIVEKLAQEGISIGKNQVLINKSIKTKGEHKVTIKLTSQLMPEVKIVIVSE